MNKKISQIIPGIVLYIFAGLVFIYAVWSFTHCADIILQAKAAGQLTAKGNEYDIASFYMGNCGQYFVFALLLAAAGFLMQSKHHMINRPGVSNRSNKDETADTELDEWFDEG
jgi:hypothetical protein